MLYYLATPFAKYAGGHERAHEDATRLAAHLIKSGYIIFSPIVHGYPLSTIGGLHLEPHEWLEFDEHMMKRCDALLVPDLPGWQESVGVNHEINYFLGAGKPVYYIDHITLAAACGAQLSRPNGKVAESRSPQP